MICGPAITLATPPNKEVQKPQNLAFILLRNGARKRSARICQKVQIDGFEPREPITRKMLYRYKKTSKHTLEAIGPGLFNTV